MAVERAAARERQTALSTTFESMGLNKALLQALASEGYTKPTPIQEKAIPDVMAGKDLLGIAQTGTGKTAAFALPILHRLAENRTAPVPRTTRALILSPTRELASQIADSFRAYIGKPQAEVPIPEGANVRILTPDMMVTMERMEGRVNLHVGTDGIVGDVTCG